MYDHYAVTSTEGDRQYVRTVIAANGRDAEHAHHEHYPHATVTAVAEAREEGHLMADNEVRNAALYGRLGRQPIGRTC